MPFKKTVDYGSMRAKSGRPTSTRCLFAFQASPLTVLETPVKTYHRLQEIMERIEISESLPGFISIALIVKLLKAN